MIPKLKRKPWIKFYFADWRADPRLKMVSRAARSFWLDVLGIMHEADPYGFLLVEGISPNTAQLASLVGDAERDVKKWLAELKAAGVPSFVGGDMPVDVRMMIPHGTPDGTMFSRRMVRDADKLMRDQENGKGGGNPTLTGEGLNGGDNPPREKPQRETRKRWTEGLTPRGQKPDTRNPPDPPGEGVGPPAPQACWESLQARAVQQFTKKFCDYWLFPCSIVEISDKEVALEAPTRLILSRVSVEGQRLEDLLEKSVQFRMAQVTA